MGVKYGLSHGRRNIERGVGKYGAEEGIWA